MTCKDCIHYEVCKWWESYSGEYGQMCCEWCNSFQDKSKFIELPCKVGEKCYKVLFPLFNEVIESELDDTDFIGCVINGFIATTKEEAEAKLKELNND